ncbi:hypothetical protein RRG08_024693 [Elysia crispata]|uniref:protein-glutamine gamma-glutamyltransferase n=1 Tax=Elysia crispata TaxID=231223 RepID=A0AAE0YDY9_9GAST|nr:hypothetical protein RRG08_024693 [Elysia crispata]
MPWGRRGRRGGGSGYNPWSYSLPYRSIFNSGGRRRNRQPDVDQHEPPRSKPLLGGKPVRFYSYSRDEGRREREDLSSAPAPDAKTLTVKSCDLKIRENCRAHNTWRYEITLERKNPKLVVRRGQPFDLELEFNREYDPAQDDLKLVFEAGEKPNPAKGTLVQFILSDKDKPKEWGAKIVSKKGHNLKISVFTPPTVYVGKWEFSVEVVKKSESTVDVYTYEHDGPIYILFNPWCKDDSVYLDDEELLKEYCLSETGRIYCGSCRNITSRPWNYGQFESSILDCALYLLDVGELVWTSRGNPIQVVRKISAVVNSNDEGGVLVGNWSGKYEDGKSPLSWTGSVGILEQYWENKKPVKYGQCWVFSGVSTTVCRALGIPARSVTNFASAHDTDGSVTIDIMFEESGERDDYMTDDSIWNFHVWNEAWMARPDLPKGFGGWQAFDATPQELSNDVYACGPVSVQAIKQGEINLQYDAPFVFAEVNADRMYWFPAVGGKMECVGCDKKIVGKFISTKLPNSSMRLDLTNTYKPEEGSAEERAAVLKANQLGSSRADLYELAKNKDVTFTLKQDSENTWVGGDFDAFLTIRNDSKQARTVSGRIAVSTMYYTGVVASKLKSEPFASITLKPGQEHEQKIKVTSREYDGKLKDCCMLDMSVWAVVKETNQHHTSKDDFRLRKPHLTIKAPDKTEAGKEFQAEVSFTNPLDGPLTKCSVTVDGLNRPLDFPQGNVAPKGTFMATLPITPKKLGHTELIVIFNSAQLEDINGSHPIFIQGQV